MSVIIDTSVFIDSLLEYDELRTKKAEKLFKLLQNVLEIIEPLLFKVELAGVLSRRFPKNQVEIIIKDILEDIKLIPNPDDLAFEIAIKTGSKAADAYFIATAKITNSILITTVKPRPLGRGGGQLFH